MKTKRKRVKRRCKPRIITGKNEIQSTNGDSPWSSSPSEICKASSTVGRAWVKYEAEKLKVESDHAKSAHFPPKLKRNFVLQILGLWFGWEGLK